MKGYKGFKHDMTCRGFQYKVGETYEESKAEICKKGFHFCENPLDVLNHYDIYDSRFAKVEGSGDITGHPEDSKHVSTKIEITAELNLKAFIEASFSFLWNICKCKKSAQMGDYSQSAQSGEYSQSAQMGYYSKSAQSGEGSKSAQSGDGSQSAQSGNYSQSAQSGEGSKSAQSGYYSKSAQSGECSQSAQSGDYSQSVQSGDYSQSAQSGDGSEITLTGQKCVGASIGTNCKIRGKIGCWITLAEYDKNSEIKCVKSAMIDGKKLKEDVFYMLKNGKMVKAK